jgi:hypothetical protein
VGQTHHNVSAFELKTGTFWTGPFVVHDSHWSLNTTQEVVDCRFTRDGSHVHLNIMGLLHNLSYPESRLPPSTGLVPDITRNFASIGTSSARHGTDHTLPKHLSIIIRVSFRLTHYSYSIFSTPPRALIELPRWGTDIQRCASCLEFVPAPSCKDLTSQVPLPRRCGP